jgi:hypothetical protein
MPDQPLTPQEIAEALEVCGMPAQSTWDGECLRKDKLMALARTLLPRALRALQQRAEDTETRLRWR